MRDQFVGDIGDFAKYGLLRTLICDGSAARRLGVVWYANEDARDSSHGEGVSYLEDNASSYRACDHDLYDSLRSVVRSGRRRIFTVEESGLLGVDTPFWSELTPGRSPQRTGWLAGALKRVEGCDLVFLDPDNGLRLESASGARSVSPEHVYKDELSPSSTRPSSPSSTTHPHGIGRASPMTSKSKRSVKTLRALDRTTGRYSQLGGDGMERDSS